MKRAMPAAEAAGRGIRNLRRRGGCPVMQWPNSGWMNWRSCKLSVPSRQSRSLSPTITTKQPPQARCLRRLFDSLPIYSSGGNSQQVYLSASFQPSLA